MSSTMMPFDPRKKMRRAAQRPDGVSRHPWRVAAAPTSSTVRPICSNRNEERAGRCIAFMRVQRGDQQGRCHGCYKPLRSVPADHIQGRPVPRRGWKWWTCGNAGMPHFHGAAGNHFQTDLVKMPELQGNRHFQISTAIFTAMRSRPTGRHH